MICLFLLELHLDNIDAPTRVEGSVGGVVRVEVGWKVLDQGY